MAFREFSSPEIPYRLAQCEVSDSFRKIWRIYENEKLANRKIHIIRDVFIMQKDFLQCYFK